jgi:four helix bundle protein
LALFRRQRLRTEYRVLSTPAVFGVKREIKKEHSMAGVRLFTDLQIWQRARAWSKAIFWGTRKQPFLADRRLVQQINDSSESIFANIAEGFGRGTQGEFVVFLGYALGSLNETQSHLCAAYDREYIGKDRFAELFKEGTDIRKMTVAFMTSMIMSGSGVKNMHRGPSWTDQVWEIYERVSGKKRPELFRIHGERTRY